MISKHDKPSFGTLNVIPLTSIKEDKTYFNDTVNLGSELYDLLYSKLKKHISKSSLYTPLNTSFYKNNLVSENSKMILKLQHEINKMKKGSIALLNQITTISKQRIFNPKSSNDLLSGIHISNSSLNLIDTKLIELFTK